MGYQQPYNFSWIDPGRLAAFGYPSSTSQLKYLIENKIPYLVTLSPEKRPPITTVSGLKWWEISIREFDAPSNSDINKFIRICEEARSNAQAVGVHCRMGRGRTGVMAACYFVKFHNRSAQDAIAEIREMRPWSIETSCQEEAVMCYYLTLCKERQLAESKASLHYENQENK